MPTRVAVLGTTPLQRVEWESALHGQAFEVVDGETTSAHGILLDVSGKTSSEVDVLVRGLGDVPVLAVGTESDVPALERAVLAGAADFAVQPSPQELALRLRRIAGREGATPHPTPSALAGPRPRALVVEDDPEMRELLTLLLEEDYDLITACHAEDGLVLAKQELPAVILLDIMLPGMDGIECLRALRKDSKTAGIPVLLLSAQRSEEARVSSIESGAADYIAKPFLGGELVARVGKAIRDAEERRSLRKLATTDPLTGMANFRSLHERIEEEVRRARRYRHSLGLIMIDMDNLKEINDRHGHDVGNRAIRRLASTVQEGLRHTDFAARFGGDEFVVVLPHSGLDESHKLAERLRERLHAVQDADFSIRASFGVSALEQEALENFDPFGAIDGDELLALADGALYDAKRQGRDCVRTRTWSGPSTERGERRE